MEVDSKTNKIDGLEEPVLILPSPPQSMDPAPPATKRVGGNHGRASQRLNHSHRHRPWVFAHILVIVDARPRTVGLHWHRHTTHACVWHRTANHIPPSAPHPPASAWPASQPDGSQSSSHALLLGNGSGIRRILFVGLDFDGARPTEMTSLRCNSATLPKGRT